MSEEIAPVLLFRGRPIGKVVEALAKAQSAFPEIKKTKTVIITSSKGDYEFKYADLADILTTTRPALSANGLAFFQFTEILQQNGREILKSVLSHSSGQYLDSETVVPITNDMKQLGGSYTYLKRYQATSLIGVAAEDDNDAKELDGVTTGPARRERAPQASQAARSASNGPASRPTPTSPEELQREAKAVGEQIMAKIAEKKWTMVQADFLVRSRFKVEPPNMSLGQMKAFLRILDKEAPPDTTEPDTIPPPKADGK